MVECMVVTGRGKFEVQDREAIAIDENLRAWPVTTLASCAVASALGEPSFAGCTIR